MKTNITLSLDIEVIEELKKNHNYSSIVNEEMKMYFNQTNKQNLLFLDKKLRENKQFIKDKRKKVREIVKKIDAIKIKEASARRNMTMGEFLAHRRRLKLEKENELLKGGGKK